MVNTSEKVIKVIASQLNIPEADVSLESTFDNLGADSLDQIEILMRVEEQLHIEISDECCEHVKTVKELVDCVNSIINQ